MTDMWQEGRGELIFRFQTDEPKVAEKMRRRKRFDLVAWGMNCKIWIFKAVFYSPQKARNALAQLTGRKVKKDSLKDIYYT
jgi:hypothetical protein